MSALDSNIISHRIDSYVSEIQKRLNDLPKNALTQTALLAIGNNEELPKYQLLTMQRKVDALKNWYHDPNIPFDDRKFFQEIFQKLIQKNFTSVQAQEKKLIFEIVEVCFKGHPEITISQARDELEVLAEGFSSQDMKKLLELALFQFQPNTKEEMSEGSKKIIELIHTLIKNLGLDIDQMSPLHFLNMSMSIIQKQEEEAESLIDLIRPLIPLDLPKEEKSNLLSILFAASVHKNFDEMKFFLEYILSLIPPHLVTESKIKYIECLARGSIKKSYEDSIDLIKFSATVLPQGLSEENHIDALSWLCEASAGKSLEDFKSLVDLFLEITPKNLSDEHQMKEIIISFAKCCREKSFEDSKDLLKFIKKKNSKLHTTEQYLGILALLDVLKTKPLKETIDLINGIEAYPPTNFVGAAILTEFKKSRREGFLALFYYAIVDLARIQDIRSIVNKFFLYVDPKIIESILTELNDSPDKDLVTAVLPFLSLCSYLSIQSLFSIFRKLPKELRISYSQLADALLPKNATLKDLGNFIEGLHKAKVHTRFIHKT